MADTVGELLTEILAHIGICQVFGVVGDALNPFTDAIRRNERMQWIGVRHEEGAALAAAGQAKLTGRLGVCAGTTGPGATHLLAGLYEASHDHAPVLAIAGDVPTSLSGISYLQAADHVQAFRDACVYAASINSAEAAAAQIHEAIAAAYGLRGVALLNIPQDIFAAKTSTAAISLTTLRRRAEIAPDDGDLDGAARIIDAGQDTVIFVGDGARNAAADISTLARKLHAPIVHTYRALDLYPFEDPQVIGGLGLIGSKAAYDAVHRCDVMLMVGSDYPYSEFLPRKAAVIQVDERAEAIGRRLPVSQAVVGSSRPSIAGLTPRVKARTSDRWLRAAQHDCASWRHMLDEKADPERSKQRIHPQALARTVSDLAATAVFPTRPWRSGLKSGNQRRSRARSSALTSANASSTRF